MPRKNPIERLIAWIGSPQSLAIHTLLFAASFGLSFFGLLSFDRMLLVLTTALSLEAIYLAIFIQMTVNAHAASLREVEEDVDEIQEDIDEIQEDVEEVHEDLEEIAEAADEDERRDQAQAVTLEQLTAEVRKVLADLESYKKQS